MYHPYQCNVCNIYESSGNWLGIVAEVWSNLKQDNPNVQYNQGAYCEMRAGGNKISARQDCSGMVSAALTLYGMTVGVTTDCQGSYSSHSMGSGWADPPKCNFSWRSGSGNY